MMGVLIPTIRKAENQDSQIGIKMNSGRGKESSVKGDYGISILKFSINFKNATVSSETARSFISVLEIAR